MAKIYLKKVPEYKTDICFDCYFYNKYGCNADYRFTDICEPENIIFKQVLLWQTFLTNVISLPLLFETLSQTC